MGHFYAAELSFNQGALKSWEKKELIPLNAIERVRKIMGVRLVFLVSCTGLLYKDLNEAMLDNIAKKIKGKTRLINFNLPDQQNISPHMARYMFQKHGLITEIKINNQSDLDFWNKQNVP